MTAKKTVERLKMSQGAPHLTNYLVPPVTSEWVLWYGPKLEELRKQAAMLGWLQRVEFQAEAASVRF